MNIAIIYVFSLGLDCRFFINLIASRDCRPNLYVRQTKVYVRQYGGIIIQIFKKQIGVSVITYIYGPREINQLLGLLLTVYGYILGCSIS